MFDGALAAGLDEVIEGVPKFQSEHGADWAKAFAEYYLRKPHRGHLARGCAMATLTPEVVRNPSPLSPDQIALRAGTSQTSPSGQLHCKAGAGWCILDEKSEKSS